MEMLLQILAELSARKDNTARKHKHLDLFAIAHPVIRTQREIQMQVEPHAATHTRPPTTALRLQVTQRYTRHLATE